MSARERIVIAMSGGVDSAVAAARLVSAGYEVVGVTLHLWDYPDTGAGSHGRCCAPEDQYDARQTADVLGFAHYTFDRRELFAEKIVEPFVEAYSSGVTPSPCTTCNREVKLKELFHIADKLGARRVATGHYARVIPDASGAPWLYTGKDVMKDQSYFLYATPRAQLERLAFPLGESTKPEVRAEAVHRRLPGATKGESQELCFVGQGAHAYADFVEQRGATRIRPGNIVDETGRKLGAHDGIHNFTIGQRKGLGVAVGKPAFVTRIDSISGTVQIGDSSGLFSSQAVLEDVVLPDHAPPPGRATVKIRYRDSGTAASIDVTGREAKLSFDNPVRAVTPGQIAVFYDGDRVLGGGRIARVL